MDLFNKKSIEVPLDGVYAVFDAKANIHLEPFRAQTDGVAVRGFMDGCKNPQSQLFKHPEDFSLWKIAMFDSVKGRYENLDRPLNLLSASSVVDVAVKP